jgi:metal-responsive CopG/Arc/MetJ family transcriptional regulator
MTRHTQRVKVAVSIPDDVYADADRVARQRGINRSALYTRALRRFLAEEGGDELIRQIDATCEEAPHDDLTAVARVDLIDTGAWAW